MSPELSDYIVQYGYIAIFSLVFLQEIGVPNPIANELVLVFSGYLTSIQKLDFMTVLITVIAADTIGTSLLYTLFFYFGPLVLQKWPRFIPTSRLAYFTTRVTNHNCWSIYIGRLIPFIRGYTSVAAGLLHIPPSIFLPAVLLSALTWSGGYVIAGRLLGYKCVHVVLKLAIGRIVLSGLGLLAIIAFFWPRMHQRLKKKRAHTP